MLKQRIITAAILIPITLAILFYLPSTLFCLLTGLFILAAAFEWSALIGLQTLSARLLYLILMAVALIGALFITAQGLFLFASIWWICALLLILFYPRQFSFLKTRTAYGLMGFFVLVPCWAALNYARNQNDGTYAILFLFILIWGADSAAYFVGRSFGKHKLAPRVSPGKSIEGALGAIIFGLLFTIATLWVAHIPFSIGFYGILLSIVTILFSIVGDLFESMLKRSVGLKDSGQILPGHGGLLDRIDSLTAAAPIFVFGAILLGKYVY